jgi:hypothetical protein
VNLYPIDLRMVRKTVEDVLEEAILLPIIEFSEPQYYQR